MGSGEGKPKAPLPAPGEAKTPATPTSQPDVKRVVVPYFSVRVFARALELFDLSHYNDQAHVGKGKRYPKPSGVYRVRSTGGKAYNFVEEEVDLTDHRSLVLSYGVTEAAVIARTYVADRHFQSAGRMRDEASKAPQPGDPAPISGKVKLTVGDAEKYGFVDRDAPAAPTGSIEIEVKDGVSKYQMMASEGTYVLVLKSPFPAAFPPAGPPAPPTTIKVEITGEWKDKDGNKVSPKQINLEHDTFQVDIPWDDSDPHFPRGPEPGARPWVRDRYQMDAYRPTTCHVRCTSKISPEELDHRFPKSDSIGALDDKFEQNVRAFIKWIKTVNGGSNVGVSTVFRSAPKAYLFYYARKVATKGVSHDKVPHYKELTGAEDTRFEVDFRPAKWYLWRHGVLNRSKTKYNKVAPYNPPGLVTNHNWGLAIDMNIPMNVTVAKKVKFTPPPTYWGVFKKSIDPATQAKKITAQTVKNTKGEVEVELDPKKDVLLSNSQWKVRPHPKKKNTYITGTALGPSTFKIDGKDTKVTNEEKKKGPWAKKAKETDRQYAKRIADEEARRHKEKTDNEIKKKEQDAKKKAIDAKKGEGNWWTELHEVGKKYFGVVHFTPVAKDLPHWSPTGG